MRLSHYPSTHNRASRIHLFDHCFVPETEGFVIRRGRVCGKEIWAEFTKLRVFKRTDCQSTNPKISDQDRSLEMALWRSIDQDTEGLALSFKLRIEKNSNKIPQILREQLDYKQQTLGALRTILYGCFLVGRKRTTLNLTLKLDHGKGIFTWTQKALAGIQEKANKNSKMAEIIRPFDSSLFLFVHLYLFFSVSTSYFSSPSLFPITWSLLPSLPLLVLLPSLLCTLVWFLVTTQ